MTKITENFEAWLAERVDIPPLGFACWYWKLSSSSGYGVTFEGGRTRQAHRVVYEHLVGRIPDGLEIDHLCRNRICVNPDHCEPVTSGENTRRGAAGFVSKARAAAITQCPSGHQYTSETMYLRANGHRICKECVRIRNKRRYA